MVQRACNHKAVETYRYDADGNLKAAETDITTWEERNTEIYGWLNTESPPFEPRPQSVNKFRRGVASKPANDPTSVADYEDILDQMTSKVQAVPPLKSSMIVSEEKQTTGEGQPDLVLRSKNTRVDGQKRSHSEHCVTYKSSLETAAADRNSTKTPAHITPAIIANPPQVKKGLQIWTPPMLATKQTTASGCDGAKKPGFIKPSPVGCRVETDFGTQFNRTPTNKTVQSLTSLAERQRKRCIENRMRKSGKQSPNFHQHQQQLHQQQQWRQTEIVKNY